MAQKSVELTQTRLPLGRSLARWAWAPLVLTVCVSMSGSALAVVPEVKDAAGFFTPDALTKADRQLAEIQKKYHKDLLIETFATVPPDKTDAFEKMDKPARAKFFQSWANDRAKKERVEGVYVLILKQPGHVQVEVGRETQKKAFAVPADQNQLRNILVENFQSKDYDRGLLQGVEFFERKLGENLHVAAAPRSEALPKVLEHGVNKVGPAVQGASGMSWIVILIIIVVGFWILRALFRGIFHMLGGGGPPRQYGPGPGGGPGYGGPGYGAPGYGGGGGGGGFMSGMLGGLFGAAAGNWLYDSFGRGGGMGGGFGGGGERSYGGGGSSSGASDADQDYSGSGGDFGGGDGGGGGGDFGGGDSGGGDSGGGDFGGGGGDFGGGGGDFGGGGGDFGGGGGDF
jgi:hypothetical protein